MKLRDKLTLLNIDCMEYMATVPDKYFDLAVVDPPYGIDVGNDGRNGLMMNKAATRRKDYKKKNWDKNVPDFFYFNQLFRVSKHQIIWGVNYYPYDFLSGGRLYWDKDTAEGYTNSDGELAYYSKSNSITSFKYRWNGMLQQDMKNKEHRIHPTQKPVRLYDWIYNRYATENCKVIDTHLGSGSNAIAAHYSDKVSEFVGCELDKDYYNDMIKRVRKDTEQLKLF